MGTTPTAFRTWLVLVGAASLGSLAGTGVLAIYMLGVVSALAILGASAWVASVGTNVIAAICVNIAAGAMALKVAGRVIRAPPLEVPQLLAPWFGALASISQMMGLLYMLLPTEETRLRFGLLLGVSPLVGATPAFLLCIAIRFWRFVRRALPTPVS